MRRLVLAPAVLATPAHAASFDCARASTEDERAVCADPRLSELDADPGLPTRRRAAAPSRTRMTGPSC